MTSDEHVCLFDCLSVRKHISRTTCLASFTNCFVPVTCGRGSVLLWRRCDTLTLCSSGFKDDVIFTRNGSHGGMPISLLQRAVVAAGDVIASACAG